MYAKKIKSIEDKEIIFLKNYNIDNLISKNKSFNYAYQKIGTIPKGTEEGKILIARFKNCAQKILHPDDIVYTIME